MSGVYLVTGPMAAGKSTVGRLLAERFERAVFVEGDWFRRCIVRGRVDVTPALADEALAQLRLRYRLAAHAADAYCRAGFTAVYEDVVAGPELPAVAGLIESRPLHVVVLLPSAVALARREAGRRQRGYGDWSVEQLHAGFAADTPRLGLWLDTSEQTAEETVAEILARAADAVVEVQASPSAQPR